MAFRRQTSFGIYPAVPKANVYVVKCFVSLMISANEEWMQFHLFSCDLMAAVWNKYSFPPAKLIPSICVTLICLFVFNVISLQESRGCFVYFGEALLSLLFVRKQIIPSCLLLRPIGFSSKISFNWFFLIWEFLVVFCRISVAKKVFKVKFNLKNPVSFT